MASSRPGSEFAFAHDLISGPALVDEYFREKGKIDLMLI
jgi:hypothetical protein